MLNRKTPPQGKPLQIQALPAFEKQILDNGIEVYMLPFGKVEAISLSAIFSGGIGHQDRPGIASYMGSTMLEGTKNYSGLEIASKLDEYGAWLNHHAGESYIAFDLATLSHHLKPTLPIMYEVLFEALFEEEEFKQLQKRNLQKKEVAAQKTTYHAQRLFGHLMFGPKHPYGMHLGKEELQELNISTLKEYHRDFIFPGNFFFTVVGNYNSKQVIQELNEQFGHLKISDKPLPESNAFSIEPQYTSGIFHHSLDKLQSTLKVGHPGFERKHPDYYGMHVVNTILGGYFGSRLNKNIREEKGYTYGISSAWLAYQKGGYFTIQSDVGNEYIEHTLEEINKEMSRMIEEKVPEEELGLVKNYLLGKSISQRETLFQMSDYLRSSLVYDISFAEMDRRFEVIQQITAEEIRVLAEKYFRPDDLLVVVCGGKVIEGTKK